MSSPHPHTERLPLIGPGPGRRRRRRLRVSGSPVTPGPAHRSRRAPLGQRLSEASEDLFCEPGPATSASHPSRGCPVRSAPSVWSRPARRVRRLTQ
eukprot:766168-Hanusia_phi.AAC.3